MEGGPVNGLGFPGPKGSGAEGPSFLLLLFPPIYA